MVKMVVVNKRSTDRHSHEFPAGCAVGTVVRCPNCKKEYLAEKGTTTRIKWRQMTGTRPPKKPHPATPEPTYLPFFGKRRKA